MLFLPAEQSSIIYIFLRSPVGRSCFENNDLYTFDRTAYRFSGADVLVRSRQLADLRVICEIICDNGLRIFEKRRIIPCR